MNRRTRSAALLLACCISLLSTAASAEDGPIRKRIKERLQQQAAPQATASTTDKITQPGDYSFTIQHDGLTRLYKLHVPAKVDPATPAPLLFALHGGGGNMDYQADDAHYGIVAKSDREGFVVVFPNGYSKLKSGKFATWNAGTCCGAARDANVDDVGFIRQVVANVTSQMNIDRSRVFATGMSNGGLMSYRLACEASDIFKAIAPVAGTDNTRSCTPKNPVAVLHIHAKNDDHVLFGGGAGAKASPDRAQVTEFTSVPDTISKWVQRNSCAATPRRVVEKPGAYCELYSPCASKAEVELCVTDVGGHSWPGASKTRGEPASQAISANDAMWEFFNRK